MMLQSLNSEMQYKVILHPLTLADLKVSTAFYEKEEAGLGKEFLNHLDSIIELIQLRPFMFREVERGIRRALTSKFNYTIFFKIVGEEIIICYVTHQSTDPEKWSNRKDLL